MHPDPFWKNLDTLLESSRLIIDRPKGSTYDRYPGFVFPYDYGYLEGTSAIDGCGIDVWLGTLPERKVVGLICTVDLPKRDAEIKLLVGCTESEMQQILAAHNNGPQAGILIRR